jgi:predicted O-methyltransferase YrrM
MLYFCAMQLAQLVFRAGVAFGYGLEFIRMRASAAKRALKYLGESSHPKAKHITNAIRESKNEEVNSTDNEWFGKIETLRETLLKSSDVILRRDFGAGHALDIDDNPEPTVRKTTVGQLCKVAGTPSGQARLLYYLVKELQPKVCLELGTCLGISTAYQGAAMHGQGKLLTIEGDAATAALARKNLFRWGLANVEVLSGSFSEVLPEALGFLKRIDYVLIDGHHDGEAMKEYFALIHPWLSKNACVVFDDIDWSAGMRKAWKEMQEQYTFGLAVDLGRVGIVVV